jgi:hypothetical protein
MLKKLGLPIIALAALMAFAAPQKADARVRFGISFGAPVYTAPVPVAPYAYGYSYPAYHVDPYAYGNGYVAPAPYVDPYVAPVAPYYGGFSLGFGGHRYYGDHERFEHERHERHERFEHGYRR